MKKVLILGLALIVSLGLSVTSFAAVTDSDTVDITVTITAATVDINNIGAGTLVFNHPDNPNVIYSTTGNQTWQSSLVGIGRGIFRNDGPTATEWSISATDFDAANFTLGSAPAGTVGVLYGVFTQWDPAANAGIGNALIPAHFEANDVITGTAATCTTTDFGIDLENDPDVTAGNVPTTGERSIYFCLDTPTDAAPGTQSYTSTATVTATIL